MSFIGIIGMNSRYEAEIQILTQPLDARFQGRIITTSRMDWWLDFKIQGSAENWDEVDNNPSMYNTYRCMEGKIISNSQLSP
jgi:hypothetical protein